MSRSALILVSTLDPASTVAKQHVFVCHDGMQAKQDALWSQVAK